MVKNFASRPSSQEHLQQWHINRAPILMSMDPLTFCSSNFVLNFRNRPNLEAPIFLTSGTHPSVGHPYLLSPLFSPASPRAQTLPRARWLRPRVAQELCPRAVRHLRPRAARCLRPDWQFEEEPVNRGCMARRKAPAARGGVHGARSRSVRESGFRACESRSMVRESSSGRANRAQDGREAAPADLAHCARRVLSGRWRSSTSRGRGGRGGSSGGAQGPARFGATNYITLTFLAIAAREILTSKFSACKKYLAAFRLKRKTYIVSYALHCARSGGGY
jgi:hypothetical protein